VTGDEVKDREADLEANMRATLSNLRIEAERVELDQTQ
jgi:hypothetical protein